MSSSRSRVQVAVGILVREDRLLLIQQRRSGTACAGQWEFPGGKLEHGESPQEALSRELQEELGIHIADARFMNCLEHDYEHANVALHTFLIYQWIGEPKGLEGQNILWGSPAQLLDYDLLEAAYPMLEQAQQKMED